MEDASSLLVLQSAPPIVVMATCTGKVYHAMLLQNNEENESVSSKVQLFLFGY